MVLASGADHTRKMTTTFENSKNGYRVKVSGFWSFFWTILIGPFYFLARGNTRHFFFGLFLALIVFPWLIYPFFAANILRTMYLERGYSVVEKRAGIEKFAVPAALVVLLIMVAAVASVVHFDTPEDPTHSLSSASTPSTPTPNLNGTEGITPTLRIGQATEIAPPSSDSVFSRPSKSSAESKSSIPATTVPSSPSSVPRSQLEVSDPMVAAIGAVEMKSQSATSGGSEPIGKPESNPLQDFARARGLSKGDGVPQDFAEAARYYQRAAESGYAPAQHQLGVAYAKGWGVVQNHQEAVLWYERAAGQGLPEAQHDLAVRYVLGLGTTKDIAKGVEWYRKAAAQGWEESITALRRHEQTVPQTDSTKVAVVTGIAADDFLSVRSAAAMNSQELLRLSQGQVIQIRGESVYNGDTEWIPISHGSQQGWVRKKYVQFR